MSLILTLKGHFKLQASNSLKNDSHALLGSILNYISQISVPHIGRFYRFWGVRLFIPHQGSLKLKGTVWKHNWEFSSCYCQYLEPELVQALCTVHNSVLSDVDMASHSGRSVYGPLHSSTEPHSMRRYTVWARAHQGNLAATTQPHFPRIVTRLSWARGAELSSANWWNGNAVAMQLEEETEILGNCANQPSHSCVTA